MRNSLVILILLLVQTSFAEEENRVLPGGQCLVCHTDMEDAATELWKNDVHAQAGIGCAECHGGNANTDDMDQAKNKSTGFKGPISRASIPKLCASCHSNAETMKKFNPLLPVDQLDKYWTSVHGKKLKQGDQNVAQCVSCHKAHGIRKVNDALSPVYAANLPGMCAKCHADAALMKPYGISTDQYSEYLESVHGKALLEKGDVRGAPACNDCHGNHGATPPGLHSISHICGSCHSRNAELFLVSPMAEAFQKDPLAECASCHGNHKITHTSDDWVGTHPEAICMKCHKEDSKGAALAFEFSQSFGKIRKEFEHVTSVVESARVKGMDVSEGEEFLQASRQSLIQARTDLHAFTKSLVDEKLDEGRKSLVLALKEGKKAHREYRTRRVGLGVSSFFLTILVVALAFFIRSLPEKPRP